ncbi:hypothetical protein LTR67_010499 [Exophiala xenobiotica]
MASLAGKVVSVTGAASGIGLATARSLYARGALLALCDVRKDALDHAIPEITASDQSSSKSRITTSVVDIRHSNQVNEWVNSTISHYDRIDGAANIAGILGKSFGVGDLTQIDDEEFDKVTSVNLKGLFNCMRAQLKVMKSGASIVNASSTTGLEGHPMNSVYSATKHAVIGLSKSAAGEFGARGIRVNCVAPGIFATPMVGSIGELDKDNMSSVFARVPLGRMGDPAEAANVFCFLLSDEASFMTGTATVVDGGMLS